MSWSLSTKRGRPRLQSIPQGPGLAVALVQRPGLGTFRKITGLTAAASLAMSLPESGNPSALSPPVHPRCARRLRGVRTAPCRKQWLIHVRSSRRSPDVLSHSCPLGLRCSCVPIRFDDRLVGMAKLVADSETSDAAFSAATNLLTYIPHLA